MVSYNMKKGLERIVTLDPLIYAKYVRDKDCIVLAEVHAHLRFSRFGKADQWIRKPRGGHEISAPGELAHSVLLGLSISSMRECMRRYSHTSHRCTVHLKPHPSCSNLLLMLFAILCGRICNVRV